jgi:hypothetical protein
MGYRFSNDKITRWEKRITWWLLGGLGVGFLVGAIGVLLAATMDVREGSTTETVLLGVVVAGAAIAGLTLVVVIYVAAILGGLSLHRHGWIVGALFATWFCAGWWPAVEVGGALGHVLYWGGYVVIGGGYWVMGHRAQVPMWVQGPGPDSPRLYVGEGDTEAAGTRFERRRERGDEAIEDEVRDA